ncbi:hypothetical protein PGTDC60_0676 [Porphyromonas gingivalis TDC60]|uniref:Uncharacterized protein n=3 Tax=Porphyromonas gingivalis TaxID=837 RepID=Q7MU99_PORGI|nr:hypothetical protein PG_1639 [Porphyromonas gingivalis W83]EIW92662.1 hypothetical protein HMPREF1322_1187 [Porphyromonas gingivalis W50]EOA09757.1 hypothetical protein A343_2100 [Porphyromonas gingivalis JCVI SC001]ERJ67391.1 hypothetical protein HMPREF1554_01043 [Porphyromonas gingivalis F0569]ERJ67986.1 hypothetical protein HMPREF1553_01276 [Porphyromonas gingivalis F0568]ERJ68767.1 hypothetical protein HMPREF1555_00202 [Porphyromonas gingivalis F0570]ERJ89041.1 hypothetical protein HMP
MHNFPESSRRRENQILGSAAALSVAYRTLAQNNNFATSVKSKNKSNQ